MQKRFAVLLALLFSTIPAFAAITGTIMDRDGKPLAGAKVMLLAQETSDGRYARLLSKSALRTPLATAQTDAKGNFSIDLAKEHATASLVVEAAGFAPLSRVVERDEETGALAVARAEMKQGRISAAGKPVAGATVTWTSGAAESTATTDADGKYSVPDPAKWASRIVVVHPDFALHNEQNINVTKSLDRSIVAGTPFTGKVVAEDGKTPLAKVAVFVDEWPLATSGDDGTFRIAHMPAKWSTVEARTSTLQSVRAKSDRNDVTLRMAKAASVSGTLKDAKTLTPVAGAIVILTRSRGMGIGGGGEARAALTDAKGNYTINPVAPGNYQLMIGHPGYNSPDNNLSVMAGQKVLRNLTASKEIRIIGTVLDEDKRPVPAARVAVSAPESDNTMMFRMVRAPSSDAAYSGPDGRFVARGSGDAEVTVAAGKKGVPNGKAGPWFLAPGEKKTGVIVTMPRGHEVTGRVVDREGKPLGGVAIVASETEPNAPGGGMVRRLISTMRNQEEELVRSANDGTFTLRAKEGTYDLDFKREGYAPKTVRAHQIGAVTKQVEVTLDAGAEISGRVVRNGVGVEGVNIVSMLGGVNNILTGPDGSFVIPDLAPGQIMLNISKFEEGVREVRNLTAPARDVVIEIPPGGRINGRVVDKNTKQPITAFQAGVSNSRSGGGMVFMAPVALRNFTSDDGTFTLENVPNGPVEIVVQAPGYTTGRSAGINMEDAKTINDIEVSLDTGSKIVGKVTGPDGSPVMGVSVNIEGSGGMPGMRMMGDGASTTTDTNGEYVLEAIEPGTRTVSFRHAKYITASKSLDISGREVRGDMQLSSGLKVTGVVVTDAGVPVPEARVSLSGGASGFGRGAVTDANGAFSFDAIAPGRYTVFARKTGYASATLRDVDVSGGVPLRVTMSGGATIHGRVTGLNEADLLGVTVEARGSEGFGSSAVDSAGNFTIEGAPTGTVRLSASSRRGFTGHKTSPSKTIQIEPGARQQVDLEFKSSTVIRGRVTRNGKPMPNAQVSFFPKDPRAQTSSSASTDESGTYTIDGLEDGEYLVAVVDMQRMAPFRTTYTVRGSGNFDIDMKSTQLTGRVVDSSTGEAIDKARVQFRSADPDMPFFNQGAVTDAQGGFTIQSIAAGKYSATAEKEGYGSQAVDITVTESGQPVELKLARTSGLTLRVVDARNGQQLNAAVSVTDQQNRVVHEDFFRFDSGTEPLRIPVAQGQYNVQVSAPNYATQRLTLMAPGTQTVGLTPGGTLLVRSKSTDRVMARLLDPSGRPYHRTSFRVEGTFPLEPRGFDNTFRNIAPGSYTLQVVGANGAVESSTRVTIVEGQMVTAEI